MKPLNILFTLMLLMSSFHLYGQENEKLNYQYNFLFFETYIDKYHFTVYLDNGETVKEIRNKEGEKIKFKTPAAVLNYIISKGWEICPNGNLIQGNFLDFLGEAGSFCWLIRKQCTEEEYRKSIEKGISQ